MSSVAAVGGINAPAAVTPAWSASISGPGGNRPTPQTQIAWKWSGVSQNAADFPTCSAEAIDASQSDSVCPAGSSIASGTAQLVLGSESDPSQRLICQRTLTIYNAGPNQSAFYLSGDPSDCLGLTYLAPARITYRTVGQTSVATLVVPENLSAPLPGIQGAFTQISLQYADRTRTVNGKTVGYLTSQGCDGDAQRTFTLSVSTASDTSPVNTQAVAGACPPDGTASQSPTPTPTSTTKAPSVVPVVSARLSYAFHYDAEGVTHLTSLKLRKLSKGAKVSVACSGSGCTHLRRAGEPAGGTLNLLRVVKRVRLEPGARVTVNVSAKGLAARVFRLTAHGNKGVSFAALCKLPGKQRTQACK